MSPETLIPIGVKEYGTHKIKDILEQAAYFNYIEAPENILDYGDFEREKKQSPVMEITPKIGCFVNCKYCPQQLLLENYCMRDKKRKTQLTLEEYKRILDKLSQNTLIGLIANELPVSPVISCFLGDSWYTCGDIMDAFLKRGFTPSVRSKQTVFCIPVGLGLL